MIVVVRVLLEPLQPICGPARKTAEQQQLTHGKKMSDSVIEREIKKLVNGYRRLVAMQEHNRQHASSHTRADAPCASQRASRACDLEVAIPCAKRKSSSRRSCVESGKDRAEVRLRASSSNRRKQSVSASLPILQTQMHTCTHSLHGKVYCAACCGYASSSYLRYVKREELHERIVVRDMHEYSRSHEMCHDARSLSWLTQGAKRWSPHYRTQIRHLH